jgi:hypothetical protein
MSRSASSFRTYGQFRGRDLYRTLALLFFTQRQTSSAMTGPLAHPLIFASPVSFAALRSSLCLNYVLPPLPA